MIADLKPYPEYKESGLPWLGQVPSTWRVVRNGSLFGQRNQTGYEELPILEVSLKTGVRVRDFENSTRKQVMSDMGKYKRAAKCDVAYNMMRMWQGAVGVSPIDGLVSPAYVVARPYPQVEPRFFVALFRTGDYMSEIDNCSRGIVKDRNRLYWDQFKQILSPCPPPAEQATIVRFLDWVSGRLERAIRAKRKVIALLNEQKQAIIHRAVTRGLDPSVPLKPSGIRWLGDIPQHWDVHRMVRIARLESGHTPSKSRPEFWRDDNDIPWVSLRDTKHLSQSDYISRTHTCINRLGLEHSSARLLPAGVVVFTRDASVGKAAITTCPMAVSQHLIAWVCGSRLTNEYLLRVLYAMKPELDRIGFGATIATIGMDDVRKLVTPLPPIEEQYAIVAHVRSATETLESAISRLEREIGLLREYRTRLVADVVTGKLDVREAGVGLPEEAAADTAKDDTDLSIDPEPADEEAVL